MKVVVAMENELSLVPESERKKCIVTGVGPINVIRALMDVDRNEPIVNIGYAGSNCIPVGTRVRVGKVKLYHPNVQFSTPDFSLEGEIPCYTSNDFVLLTDIKEPCVFDMELAYILALGFKNVMAEKVVSDNLSAKDFDKYVR